MRPLLVAVLLLVLGCAPSLAQLQLREQCYTTAEIEAQLEWDRLCPGQSAAECFHVKEILSRLQERQEECP